MESRSKDWVDGTKRWEWERGVGGAMGVEDLGSWEVEVKTQRHPGLGLEGRPGEWHGGSTGTKVGMTWCLYLDKVEPLPPWERERERHLLKLEASPGNRRGEALMEEVGLELRPQSTICV